MVVSSHCAQYHHSHEMMSAFHKEDIGRLDELGMPSRARGIQRHTGLLLALVSQLLYATMALFFKLLTTQSSGNLVPPSALQIIFVRMLITWSGCVIYMLVTKTPDPFFGPKEVRILLTFRGLAGFTSLFSLYFSLEKLTLAVSGMTQLLPLYHSI
jgi:EamA domain-containing membrane protein RarD